ncbi:MAG: TetR family transcriptional regulator [Stenotrophomonas maltophilia]|nr:MAG: TetR family transcriptional regulator [Stenotrophomonas maltophilia]
MVRRTRAEMEETRASLLDTARRVFSEHGYAATSMDDLTAQAGLTRGALYHHFGDKKGLLAAVVAQLDAETDLRLQAISDRAGDAWDGFVQRCRAYLEMALEPEIQRIVLRDARAVLIAQGVAVPVDAQALASLIYGSLAEAAFWIAEGEDGDARLRQATAALEMLLRGLKVAG